MSKAFTPRRIRDLEPRIREFTATLIERAARKGEFEVMADLANPLPVMVIAEMLGVSQDDYEQFKRWSDKVVESDNVPPGVEIPADIIDAFNALRAYFINEIEKRRRNPGSDLVSALVTARDEAEALSEEELIAFVVLLLLAGNETTTNLIGNGMLALGRNPEQLAKLRGDLSLMPRAIEEMLRYDCPVQATARYPKIDLEVGGVEIKSNTPMFVIVAAANRDPALGAPLAGMEGAIAIAAAIERFPQLCVADPNGPLAYKGSYFLRGLSALKMVL